MSVEVSWGPDRLTHHNRLPIAPANSQPTQLAANRRNRQPGAVTYGAAPSVPYPSFPAPAPIKPWGLYPPPPPPPSFVEVWEATCQPVRLSPKGQQQLNTCFGVIPPSFTPTTLTRLPFQPPPDPRPQWLILICASGRASRCADQKIAGRRDSK